MLKESGRERINAVYGTKEQCRKEFQDEIARLRHQFQLVSRSIDQTKIFLLDLEHNRITSDILGERC